MTKQQIETLDMVNAKITDLRCFAEELGCRDCTDVKYLLELVRCRMMYSIFTPQEIQHYGVLSESFHR